MAPVVLTPLEKQTALTRAGADLKYLLSKEDVIEDHQAIFYHFGITSVPKFASFAKDTEDLKKVLKDDFDIDPSKSLQERSMVASIVCAWTSAQTRSSKLSEVEAEMESRQWTKVIPPSDYLSMRMNFDRRY